MPPPPYGYSSMITSFPNVYKTTEPSLITIEEFVHIIKTGGNHKEAILNMRTLSKEARNELKKQLPQFCLGGEFTERNIKSIVKHSGYIPLDFDGLSKADTIALSPYIYMAWDSTSGDGSRAIVRVPCITTKINSTHAKYFAALKTHFNTPFWDDALKSCVSGAYLSYDPDIYINEDAPIWTYLPQEQAFSQVISSRQKFEYAQKWITSHGDSFTKGSRNPFIFKLASAMCRAGIPQDESISLLSTYIDTDFLLSEVASTTKSAYRSSIKDFGTWVIEEQHRQPPIHLNGTSLVVTPTDEIDFCVWVKEKPTISRAGLLRWLEQMGIRQLRVNKDGICINISVVNNIVQKVDKVFLSAMVRNHITDPIFYEVFLRGADTYLSDSMLRFLPVEDIKWNQDTKTESWIYFKNTAVVVSKGDPTTVDYNNLPGCIWKSQILDRDFTYMTNTEDFENCEFARFIAAISGAASGTQDGLDKSFALMSVIGYLLHTFKDPTLPNAIVLTDEIISDNPQGGTGKGIFIKALLKFRKHHYVDGKSFTFDRSFLWMGIDLDTMLVVMDDVRRNFDFERLFSVITEGIQVENKGKNTFYIPFESSPKYIITANAAIRGEGNSHERRKLEIEFSNYFNKQSTPYTLFGHHLYDDWDTQEWVKFDNYILCCIQYYFIKGLVAPKSVNIEYKKLSANTSSEFIEWAIDNIQTGTTHGKRALYDRFITDCSEQKRFVSSLRFYAFVVNYCQFHNIIVRQDRYAGVHSFIFSKQS